MLSAVGVGVGEFGVPHTMDIPATSSAVTVAVERLAPQFAMEHELTPFVQTWAYAMDRLKQGTPFLLGSVSQVVQLTIFNSVSWLIHLTIFRSRQEWRF